MMPHDFPKCATCYCYFRQWKQKDDEFDESLLDQILAKLVKESRVNEERKEKTSFCIIDSQSVKNAASSKSKGYDAGKKISGIKRHIGVDTQGRPYFIHVTTADVTDRNGAIEGIEKNMETFRSYAVECHRKGTAIKCATASLIIFHLVVNLDMPFLTRYISILKKALMLKPI